MGQEGLGRIHSPNRDAKQQFSRLGDRSIYYIADGPTQKKNSTDKVFGNSCKLETIHHLPTSFTTICDFCTRVCIIFRDTTLHVLILCFCAL